MKVTTYTITNTEAHAMKSQVEKHIAHHASEFAKYPTMYAHTVPKPEHHDSSSDYERLEKVWRKAGVAKAIFSQFQIDGLACINRDPDDTFTFKDYAGDTFCPKANIKSSDHATYKAAKAKLLKEERAARARFNRQGCHYYTLVVLGAEQGSIGGFVGHDFIESGYATDFYNEAALVIQERMPEYWAKILDVCINFVLAEA